LFIERVVLGRSAFKRLGFVNLADNKEDNFKSRELKSVHVDVVCRYARRPPCGVAVVLPTRVVP